MTAKPLFFLVSLTFCVCACLLANAQSGQYFPEKCLGIWEGRMYIWSKGSIRDSVDVRMTIARTDTAHVWTWKTEYLSTKYPIVKDYRLKLEDATTGKYITDEGGGLVLTDQLFGNKLYSVFEVKDQLLTASYELVAERLIFEVSSGKRQESTYPDITNFSVDHLQRVVLEKVDSGVSPNTKKGPKKKR